MEVFQPGMTELSMPSKTGRAGEFFESFMRGFNDARCRIRIVPRDEGPNCPKFFLNARRKDELRHAPP